MTEYGDLRIMYVGKMIEDEINDTSGLSNVHKECWRAMGMVQLESNISSLQQDDNKIVGVSDGSVKNGEGSAGYVILNTLNDTRIESSLPVDGSLDVMTSF